MFLYMLAVVFRFNVFVILSLIHLSVFLIIAFSMLNNNNYLVTLIIVIFSFIILNLKSF